MAGLLYGHFPLASHKRLWLLLPFILVLFIPTGLTESRASKLALLLALAALVAAQFLPALTRWVLTFLPAFCVGWPFAVQGFFQNHYDVLNRFPASWHARMEIWDALSYRILERPWLGWGLGTSHLLPFQEPHGALYVMNNLPASHPHNVVIELWVELGLPGLIAGLAFALLMLRKAGQLDKKLVPFALATWMAAFCLSLVAYDFWTDSLFAAFALSAFALRMLDGSMKGKASKNI
jgi:O-antigen ligase